MANIEKHAFKIWRGTRKSYDALKAAGKLDSWTRYVVIEENGANRELYGEEAIRNHVIGDEF